MQCVAGARGGEGPPKCYAWRWRGAAVRPRLGRRRRCRSLGKATSQLCSALCSAVLVLHPVRPVQSGPARGPGLRRARDRPGARRSSLVRCLTPYAQLRPAEARIRPSCAQRAAPSPAQPGDAPATPRRRPGLARPVAPRLRPGPASPAGRRLSSRTRSPVRPRPIWRRLSSTAKKRSAVMAAVVLALAALALPATAARQGLPRLPLTPTWATASSSSAALASAAARKRQWCQPPE